MLKDEKIKRLYNMLPHGLELRSPDLDPVYLQHFVISPLFTVTLVHQSILHYKLKKTLVFD